MSKQEIEVIGENFIRDFCPDALQSPHPINIEEFIEFYLQLKLDYQYLSNDGRYLGMTVFNNTDKVIIFDPDRNEADYLHADARTVIIDNRLLEGNQEHRYRFTMGHEGAHDILHSGYYSYNPDQMSIFANDDWEPMVQCRLHPLQTVPRSANSLWSDTDWMEWQANFLSSVLLMPKPAVKVVFDAFSKRGFSSPSLLEQGVSRVFNVSPEAARYRLLSLGYIKKKESQGISFEDLFG